MKAGELYRLSLCGSVSEKHVVGLWFCSTIILVVVFSQFLRGVQVNFCVRTEGRWEERGFPLFGVFAVCCVTLGHWPVQSVECELAVCVCVCVLRRL